MLLRNGDDVRGFPIVTWLWMNMKYYIWKTLLETTIVLGFSYCDVFPERYSI